jgi:hypothetical protein
MRLLPAPIFKPHLLAKVYSGDKSQTRRIIAPGRRPYIHVSNDFWSADEHPLGVDFEGNWPVRNTDEGMIPVRAPCGMPGDFWYFREGLASDGLNATYRLDGKWTLDQTYTGVIWRWKNKYLPSIHMPRDCARRFSRVTSVRVERVQDISETDAKAEGAPAIALYPERDQRTHKEGFQALWDSINGHRKTATGGHFRYAWEANPYVWVYEWEMVERDAIPAEAWEK